MFLPKAFYDHLPACPCRLHPMAHALAKLLQVYQINLPNTTPQHTWQNLLNPSQPVHGLGAFSADTQMVALRTSLSAPIPRRNMAMTNCCYLEDLFVAPSARKQGTLPAGCFRRFVRRPNCHHSNRIYWVTQAAATGLRNSFTGKLPSNPTCCSSVMIWAKLFKAKAQLRS